MGTIHQMMAEQIMDKYGHLINMTTDKLTAVLNEAWGQDRAAAVWTVDDILDAAEYYEVEMTVDEARGIMRSLAGRLESYNGNKVLADLIAEFNDDTDY